MQNHHAFDAREFRNELDQFLNRLLPRANFFQRDDFAFFENQQRLDAEHPAQQGLRFAHPSAAFQIIQSLDEKGDVNAWDEAPDEPDDVVETGAVRGRLRRSRDQHAQADRDQLRINDDNLAATQ